MEARQTGWLAWPGGAVKHNNILNLSVDASKQAWFTVPCSGWRLAGWVGVRNPHPVKEREGEGEKRGAISQPEGVQKALSCVVQEALELRGSGGRRGEARVCEGASSGPPPRPTTGGPITSKKDVFAYGSLTTKFQKVKIPVLV